MTTRRAKQETEQQWKKGQQKATRGMNQTMKQTTDNTHVQPKKKNM